MRFGTGRAVGLVVMMGLAVTMGIWRVGRSEERTIERAGTGAQAPTKYQATIESLNRHPLPEWYADAKLGIFIHWGLYSVPGWAVLTPEGEKMSEQEYLKRNPYAEWYLNTLRLDGSPTQAYHKEHYGATFDYYNFAETFNREIRSGGRRSGPRSSRMQERGMWC